MNMVQNKVVKRTCKDLDTWMWFSIRHDYLQIRMFIGSCICSAMLYWLVRFLLTPSGGAVIRHILCVPSKPQGRSVGQPHHGAAT